VRLRFSEKWVGLLIIAVALTRLGMFAAEGLSPKGEAPRLKASTQAFTVNRRMACHVLTVYDGDTLGCDLNGNGRIERPQEEVRLLGIDTPEMHYSRKNPTYGSANPTDEPYAKEASRWGKTMR
jgi:endonuclease YncB( thermonuclease family)